MAKTMPQEIEVWYVIPAVRRELAKILIKDFKIMQKETANLLGVTEAAVSQYLSSKRAQEIKFTQKELEHIKKTASEIIKDKKNVIKHMCRLISIIRGSPAICKVHRRVDKKVPRECSICSAK